MIKLSPSEIVASSLSALISIAIGGFVSPAVSRAADRDGAAIYREDCARCHGASGQGSVEHKRPLAGDRSVNQLARLIAKTMPEDDPGTCSEADAQKVAAYIHEAFYSRTARARNRPPRIEASRLTVRQYRNAVADLVGSFREPSKWDDSKRGLTGQYYKSRRFRSSDLAIERLDERVEFDFGVKGPEPEKFDANEFTIRWEGSLLAPESGVHEFVVRTEHAARLWVNDLNPNKPLIDAWVKSGNDVEYRAPITLLAGRPYSIRLEFSKAKQGVDDSAKNKDKKPPEIKASIALAWKRPNRPVEVIASRHFSPVRNPETFVVETPFPPDDRSLGYVRGSSVSKAWDSSTTDAAVEVANYVTSTLKLRELTGASLDDKDRVEKFRDFARKFAERAFRRPASELKPALDAVDRLFEGLGGPQLALKRSILYVLKSPRFLYRDIRTGPPDAYEVAARLSFGLWDSIPDKALLEAAASGKTATREPVVAQAERMLADPRARAKLGEFLLQWLNVEQYPDIAKDPEKYPGFDAPTIADLRESLELTLDDVVWSPSSDFRRLLLSEELFLNGRLAKFLGVELPEKADFRKVPLEPKDRSGVLSHPYLLATYAYTRTTSPIHRGVFITRSLLGRTLRPPPEAVAPLAPDLHPSLSTRERVVLQTSPAACQSCHNMINPLGFGLERFDAVGRLRKEEQGKPIDATGFLETRDGRREKYDGARELGALLVKNDETREAFVEQLFHEVIKQPIRAYGPNALSDLTGSFRDRDFHIRKLIVEILARAALTPRTLENPQTVKR